MPNSSNTLNGSISELVKLTKADFESDQEIRWCPGCGDYSVLAAVQKFLPSLNIPREKFVFVSGIGCSSRFPYYMNTYGFHTIHGRAPAIATGIKATNPDLSVWVITGDGDALSIGGNHLIHLLRRNIDLNVLLFNNRIYGLTKGQYSPTSEIGKVTKSTPYGSLDAPLNPLALALGANATFVARTLDIDAKHMTEILQQAADHRGCSFIEIYQNCPIFNDDTFKYVAERSVRQDAQLHLNHGQLLIFGKEKNKGLRLNGLKLEVVEFPAGDTQAAQAAGVITYDCSNQLLATAMTRLEYPDFPVPMGVIYKETRPTFDQALQHRKAQSVSLPQPNKSADDKLTEVFNSGESWVVL